MSMSRAPVSPQLALLGIAFLLAGAPLSLRAQAFGVDYTGIDTSLPARTLFPDADALPPGTSSAPGFKLGNGANAAQVNGSFTTGIGVTSGGGTSYFNAGTINIHKPFGDGGSALNISVSAAEARGPGFIGGYGGYGGYYGYDDGAPMGYGPPMGYGAPMGADNAVPLGGPQNLSLPQRGRGGR